VAVLDLSSVALDEARRRLADPAGVEWIERDLLVWEPLRPCSVWHDRAVLHVLVDDEDRDSSVRQLRRTLEPGGESFVGVPVEAVAGALGP
jgi:trans-aconitate methyltransferase